MYTVYGKLSCDSCDQAKALLTAKGLEFEYKQFGKDYDLGEFSSFNKAHRSFPLILKDGKYLGGLVELKEVLATKYSK